MKTGVDQRSPVWGQIRGKALGAVTAQLADRLKEDVGQINLRVPGSVRDEGNCALEKTLAAKGLRDRGISRLSEGCSLGQSFKAPLPEGFSSRSDGKIHRVGTRGRKPKAEIRPIVDSLKAAMHVEQARRLIHETGGLTRYLDAPGPHGGRANDISQLDRILGISRGHTEEY